MWVVGEALFGTLTLDQAGAAAVTSRTRRGANRHRRPTGMYGGIAYKPRRSWRDD
jgi:hypothetical protein